MSSNQDTRFQVIDGHGRSLYAGRVTREHAERIAEYKRHNGYRGVQVVPAR